MAEVVGPSEATGISDIHTGGSRELLDLYSLNVLVLA
jgi:hypothetical protein